MLYFIRYFVLISLIFGLGCSAFALDLQPLPVRPEFLESHSYGHTSGEPTYLKALLTSKGWQQVKIPQALVQAIPQLSALGKVYYPENYHHSRKLIFVEAGIIPVNFSAQRVYTSGRGFNLYLPEQVSGQYTKLRFINFTDDDFKSLARPLRNLAGATTDCDLENAQPVASKCFRTMISDCPKRAMGAAIKGALVAMGGWLVSSGLTTATYVCDGNPVTTTMNIAEKAVKDGTIAKASKKAALDLKDYLKSCLRGVWSIGKFTVDTVARRDQLMDKIEKVAFNGLKAVSEKANFLVTNAKHLSCHIVCTSLIKITEAIAEMDFSSFAELEMDIQEVVQEVAAETAKTLATKPKTDILYAFYNATNKTVKCLGSQQSPDGPALEAVAEEVEY